MTTKGAGTAGAEEACGEKGFALSLNRLSSGPIVAPALRKAPFLIPIERCLSSLEKERTYQEASFDSKPLRFFLSLSVGEGSVRLALTKGDACMWCSHENQNNSNGPPLSDGDALPFPTSVWRGGLGCPP